MLVHAACMFFLYFDPLDFQLIFAIEYYNRNQLMCILGVLKKILNLSG